jgi:hypothetical protein
VTGSTRLHALGGDVVAAALGRGHRVDPVLARTGGPAGNSRLTAWTGILLLGLFLAELVTLLDVRGLISWHLAVGVALLPPSLLKTATTGWRIARYYAGNGPYRTAGPPPTILRVLGPLVVLATLALLGTGLLLVFLGEPASHRTLATVLGQRVDTVTLHQAAFAFWCVVTGLHVVGRLVPAWQVTRDAGSAVPGRHRRTTTMAAVLALSVVSTGWLLAHSGGWRDVHPRPPFGPSGPPGTSRR